MSSNLLQRSGAHLSHAVVWHKYIYHIYSYFHIFIYNKSKYVCLYQPLNTFFESISFHTVFHFNNVYPVGTAYVDVV